MLVAGPRENPALMTRQPLPNNTQLFHNNLFPCGRVYGRGGGGLVKILWRGRRAAGKGYNVGDTGTKALGSSARK